jgi:hypothetical protein
VTAAAVGFAGRTAPLADDGALICVATTYCSPDADEAAYEALKRLAKRENVEEMQVFKAELREALCDQTRLPENRKKLQDPSKAADREPRINASHRESSHSANHAPSQ